MHLLENFLAPLVMAGAFGTIGYFVVRAFGGRP